MIESRDNFWLGIGLVSQAKKEAYKFKELTGN